MAVICSFSLAFSSADNGGLKSCSLKGVITNTDLPYHIFLQVFHGVYQWLSSVGCCLQVMERAFVGLMEVFMCVPTI